MGFRLLEPLSFVGGSMFVQLWAFVSVKTIGASIEGQVNWKKSRP